MATMYLADDLRHRRKLAIKVLHPELAAAIGTDRFFSEIRTTASLQHPQIPSNPGPTIRLMALSPGAVALFRSWLDERFVRTFIAGALLLIALRALAVHALPEEAPPPVAAETARGAP